MTKTELKARLEEAKARAEALVTEKFEIAQMKSQLSLLENPTFLEAQARAYLRKHTSDTLAEYATLCESIVTDNPIQNRRTRSVRIWNPTKQYGMGNHVAELTGLLSGIQYSIAEHAQLMYAVVPLNPDLVESTLNSFGQLPYYSTNYGTVINGTPGNPEAIRTNISLIEAQLGIEIDKSHITQEVIDARYASALARANADKAEAELTANTQHFVIT